MIDWFVEKVGNIARTIFHWSWRVQTRRRIYRKKK
jgi:hypothetical protein